MSGYAGNLNQTDYKAIEDLGQLDNTRVIYIAGDNGASARPAGPA
jgi:arylsulfatase A-like enzyme